VRKVTIDGQHILFDCNIDTHIDDFVKACANRPVLKAFRNCLTFNKTYEGPLERVLNHKIARDMVAGTTQLSQPHHTKNVLRTFGFWHTSQRITPMKPNIRLGLSKDENDQSPKPDFHKHYFGIVGTLGYLVAIIRPLADFVRSSVVF